jgi:hypothetical protein
VQALDRVSFAVMTGDRRADRPVRLRQDHRASGCDGARSVERGPRDRRRA